MTWSASLPKMSTSCAWHLFLYERDCGQLAPLYTVFNRHNLLPTAVIGRTTREKATWPFSPSYWQEEKVTTRLIMIFIRGKLTCLWSCNIHLCNNELHLRITHRDLKCWPPFWLFLRRLHEGTCWGQQERTVTLVWVPNTPPFQSYGSSKIGYNIYVFVWK